MNPENKQSAQTPSTINQCSGQSITMSPTLAEWMDEWMDTYKTCSVKPQTAKMYREIIALINTCSETTLPLAECTERDMQRLLNSLQNRRPAGRQSTYSKSILKKVRMTLNESFKKAKKERLLISNPCSDLIVPESPTKKILPLSHKEQERVEQACHIDPLGHLYIFLLRTGIRLSELINLEWSDYDPEEGKFSIRASKTPAGVRDVYLLKEAQDIIEAQPRLGRQIFYHTKGKPITKSTVYHMTKRIQKGSQVSRLTPHVCRHTFVTRLCENNVSAKTIAQIIGHARADYVLNIYASLEKQEERKAIYVLEPKKTKDKLSKTIE